MADDPVQFNRAWRVMESGPPIADVRVALESVVKLAAELPD